MVCAADPAVHFGSRTQLGRPNARSVCRLIVEDPHQQLRTTVAEAKTHALLGSVSKREKDLFSCTQTKGGGYPNSHTTRDTLLVRVTTLSSPISPCPSSSLGSLFSGFIGVRRLKTCLCVRDLERTPSRTLAPYLLFPRK